MRTIPRPAAICAALSCLLLLPASAAAETPAPGAPTTPSLPAPAPVAGKIRLVLQKVGGRPLFATVGGRVVVRGIVTPYVAGQTVKVSFYREGRKVAVSTVSVLSLGNGAGQFHVGFSSHDAGLVQARAAHYATRAAGRLQRPLAERALRQREPRPGRLRRRRCGCCSPS